MIENSQVLRWLLLKQAVKNYACALIQYYYFSFIFTTYYMPKFVFHKQHRRGRGFTWMWHRKKNSYTFQTLQKNYTIWSMCFTREVSNVCSLSMALGENGKLLNPVNTARLRLSSGIINRFWSPFVMLYTAMPNPKLQINLINLFNISHWIQKPAF